MWDHLHFFLQGDTSGKPLGFFAQRSKCERTFDKLFIWPESESEFRQLRPAHKPFNTPNRSLSGILADLCLAAHDDCFLRASFDAHAAEDATQHIDIEPGRHLFDHWIRVLFRLDVDAIGGTGCRTHIACNTPWASVC